MITELAEIEPLNDGDELMMKMMIMNSNKNKHIPPGESEKLGPEETDKQKRLVLASTMTCLSYSEHNKQANCTSQLSHLHKTVYILICRDMAQ